jgi:hypothetical protein
MVPAPRRLFVVRCIRTSGITPSYLRFRSRQGALRICERCDYVGVLLRPHTPSSMDTWVRTPRGSCLVSMRCGHVESAGARACARVRVCVMHLHCKIAPVTISDTDQALVITVTTRHDACSTASSEKWAQCGHNRCMRNDLDGHAAF